MVEVIVNSSVKILNGKSRNKQLMSFKLRAVLSSVMKSREYCSVPSRT